MKYFFLFALIICFGCDNRTVEPTAIDSSLISGKWKEVEAFISAGGPQYWVDVNDGEEIEFFDNETFFSDRFSQCSNGNFFIEKDELFLKFNCSDFILESENEDGFVTYTLEFYSNYFILTPTSGPICIEGCSYKYEKK